MDEAHRAPTLARSDQGVQVVLVLIQADSAAASIRLDFDVIDSETTLLQRFVKSRGGYSCKIFILLDVVLDGLVSHRMVVG